MESSHENVLGVRVIEKTVRHPLHTDAGLELLFTWMNPVIAMCSHEILQDLLSVSA